MPRFKRAPIVVPVDYSDASLRAVRTARGLVDSPSDLTAVYALANMDLIVPGHRWGGVLSHDEQRATAVTRMNEWLTENELDDINHEVLIGDAGLEVSKFVKESEANLVVLPSHGRHGLKRLLLGSVAERIVRHCECSVLVLKHRAADPKSLISEAWLPRKRVVVPVDFSRSTPETVWLALELVDNRTNVDVINVLPPMEYIYGEMLMTTTETDADRRGERQKYLERYLAENDLDVVRAHVLTGDPGTTITDYANEHSADLIVIPSHGYHGISRIVLGSVAERVLRHADCPVLVTRRLDSQ